MTYAVEVTLSTVTTLSSTTSETVSTSVAETTSTTAKPVNVTGNTCIFVKCIIVYILTFDTATDQNPQEKHTIRHDTMR